MPNTIEEALFTIKTNLGMLLSVKTCKVLSRKPEPRKLEVATAVTHLSFECLA